MKVVVAVDSFKGCMTSNEVNQAVSNGIKMVFPDAEVIKVPIADGGEGTVETLIEGLGGELIEKEVNGPLMKPVIAKYGILKDQTAVIEMASASGLPLVKSNERNPLKTTTYGVGELINDAINRGCRNFIVGIGGSATNDAGCGMLQALGYRFFDQEGTELNGTGESLSQITSIDVQKVMPELKDCHFQVACDVDNPLYGPRGAAYVFARQKGADDQMVEQLDQGLKHFASVVKKEFNKEIDHISGTGAAGGLGGGFVAFLNAELKPGISIIFDQLNLEQKVVRADCLITGEGRMDFQSVMGKAPSGIAKLGQRFNIPVIAIAGSLTDDAYDLHQHGITALFSIMNEPMTLEEAMESKQALKRVEMITSEIFRLIKMR